MKIWTIGALSESSKTLETTKCLTLSRPWVVKIECKCISSKLLKMNIYNSYINIDSFEYCGPIYILNTDNVRATTKWIHRKTFNLERTWRNHFFRFLRRYVYHIICLVAKATYLRRLLVRPNGNTLWIVHHTTTLHSSFDIWLAL